MRIFFDKKLVIVDQSLRTGINGYVSGVMLSGEHCICNSRFSILQTPSDDESASAATTSHNSTKQQKDEQHTNESSRQEYNKRAMAL